MQTEQKFLDDKGRLRQWPSKRTDKTLVLAYLLTKFDFDSVYSEYEVNELLKVWHTYNDWPLLRRELYEQGFLERNLDGSNYHVKRIQTSLPDLYLTVPNIKNDPSVSLEWLVGKHGKETLLLMGNTEVNSQPSTLKAEEQRIRDFVTSTSQRTWSLYYVSKLVGAIWVDLKSSEYLAHPAIHIMIGDPSMRGKGIGQAAMEAIIKLLEQEGEHQVVYSRYLVENIGSAKLLEKVGFIKDGIEYTDVDGLRFQNVKRSLRSLIHV